MMDRTTEDKGGNTRESEMNMTFTDREIEILPAKESEHEWNRLSEM